jgi:hypothetical protein
MALSLVLFLVVAQDVQEVRKNLERIADTKQ